MATLTRKNLGGGSKPSASVLTDIYTVPASTTTVVSTIWICNIGQTTASIRVKHALAAAADADQQYLLADYLIAGNQFLPITCGICMAATDVLRVYSNNGNVVFNLWGEESS